MPKQTVDLSTSKARLLTDIGLCTEHIVVLCKGMPPMLDDSKEAIAQHKSYINAGINMVENASADFLDQIKSEFARDFFAFEQAAYSREMRGL